MAENLPNLAAAQDFDGIIFDFGGVLVSHQLGSDIDRIAGLVGLDRAALDQRYWARRQEYDEDKLTLSEYWNGVAARDLPADAIGALSDADTASWMHYDEPMWEWITELRRIGKRTAILSNMPRDLGVRLRKETSRLGYFDHITLSYELGVAKPEAAIYEHCLKGIGTEAGRTLFLDDRIANVNAAKKLGIAAVQFTSRQDVLPVLV